VKQRPVSVQALPASTKPVSAAWQRGEYHAPGGKILEGRAIIDIDLGTRDPLDTLLLEIARIKYD
jgi:hypothetical protein